MRACRSRSVSASAVDTGLTWAPITTPDQRFSDRHRSLGQVVLGAHVALGASHAPYLVQEARCVGCRTSGAEHATTAVEQA